MAGQCSVLDVAFCSVALPVTPWGDFLDVEKVTKDTFRRRGLRFPRLLKTSTLEPPKRNRARFPFDSLRGMARIRLISVVLMLCLFSQKGHSPLALPLGELSPKATERGKAVCRCLWQIKACRFLNDKINLFALSVLAALGHLSQGERQGMPAERPAVGHRKKPQKDGGTPPPDTFRQNGMSVLPFVYFQQSQYIEIVKVILLSIKKSKKERKDKKHEQKRPKVQ